MSDQAEKWRNVAQAAQWLAEGREVEYRNRPGQGFAFEWGPLKYSGVPEHLFTFNEYRLKPEPPKPREWIIPTHKVSGLLFEGWRNALDQIEWVRVIEAPK